MKLVKHKKDLYDTYYSKCYVEAVEYPVIKKYFVLK